MRSTEPRCTAYTAVLVSPLVGRMRVENKLRHLPTTRIDKEGSDSAYFSANRSTPLNSRMRPAEFLSVWDELEVLSPLSSLPDHPPLFWVPVEMYER